MTEFFYMRVVEALGGGVFQDIQDIRFSSKKSAQEAAEGLQADFDDACEPKRVYILGADRVVIDAAGKAKMGPMKSLRRS